MIATAYRSPTTAQRHLPRAAPPSSSPTTSTPHGTSSVRPDDARRPYPRDLAADDREIVNERITRLDDGRARDAGGLGLGLSMVKAITEQPCGLPGRLPCF